MPDDYQLSPHCLALYEVLDVNNVDELVELLNALVKRLVVALERGGNSRTSLDVSGPDVEGVYIESASTKKPGNASENAELILD